MSDTPEDTSASASHAPSREAQPMLRALTRWRRVAIASIATNIFVIGVVAGGAILRPRFHGPGGPGRSPPFTIHAVQNILGESARERARQIEQSHDAAIEPALDALHRQVDEVNRRLAAEPFDEEALAAALAELRRLNDAFQSGVHSEFVALAKILTPEERGKLADEGTRRGPPGRRPGGPPPPR
jgi:uncharacterized membrane protein